MEEPSTWACIEEMLEEEWISEHLSRSQFPVTEDEWAEFWPEFENMRVDMNNLVERQTKVLAESELCDLLEDSQLLIDLAISSL